MMNHSATRIGKILTLAGLVASMWLVWASGAMGQESHRVLNPPGKEANSMAANAALLRQLQALVEQSGGGNPLPMDPTQIDPKLLAALQQMATQLGDGNQLSPLWKQWLESMKEQQPLSVPPGLPSNLPQIPRTSNGNPNTSPPPRNEPNNNTNPGNNTNLPNPDPQFAPPKLPNGEPRNSPTNIPETGDPGKRGIPGQGTGKPLQPGEVPSTRSPLEPSVNGKPGTKGPNGASINPNLEQLRESGLTIQQQFDRIVEQARRDAILKQGNEPSEPADVGGMATLLNDMLAKSTNELAERLQSAQRGKSGPGGRGRSQLARNLESLKLDRSTKKSLAKGFESFSANANALSKTITASEKTPAAEPSTNLSFSTPSAAGSLWGLGMLLALVAMAAGAYAEWHFRRESAALAQQRVRTAMPPELATRADCIRAFHALAARTAAAEHSWWTHWRASGALVEASPLAKLPLEALTQIYEQARYLPPDEPLNSAQLQLARQALYVALPVRLEASVGRSQ